MNDGEINDLRDRVLSIEAAFKNVSDLIQKSIEASRVSSDMTDRLYRTIIEKDKEEKTWRTRIEKFMEDTSHCLNGNGKIGIKAQVFAIWLIGGGVISAMGFLFWYIFINNGGLG